MDNVIREKLNQVKKQILKFEIVRGSSLLFLICFGIFLISFILDFIFHLGNFIRWIVLICWISAIIAILILRIIVPIFRPVKDSSLALKVEKKYPELNDRFVSTVELKNSTLPESMLGSYQLIEALENETVEYLKPIDVTRSIDFTKIRKTLVLAIILIFIVGINKIIFPQLFNTWMIRFFNPASDIQPFTFTQIEVEPKNCVVPQGDPLLIKANISGRLVDEVKLYYRFAQEKWNSLLLLRAQDNKKLFTHTFPEVNKPFDYYCVAGDGKTPMYKVVVEPRPNIMNVTVKYKYPSYTRKPTKEEKGEGIIEALVGTKVELIARATTELSKGEIEIKMGDKIIKEDMRTSGIDAISEFNILSSGNYSIKVFNKKGFANKEMFIRSIRALEDKPPVVDIPEPGKEETRTVQGKLNIKVHAVDDYGIREILLFMQKRGANQKPIQKKLKYEVPFDLPNVGIALYTIDLSSLNLTQGDVVEYWAESKDTNPNYENIGKSPVYTIRTISPEEKEVELAEMLTEIKEKVGKILKEESELKEKTAEMVEKAPYDANEKSQINQLERTQERLKNEMSEVANELNTLKNARKENRLDPERTMEQLSRWQNASQELSQVDMPQAQKNLSSAKQEQNPQKQKENMMNAKNKEGEIVDKLKNLFNELNRSTGLYDIAKALNDMIDKQKDVENDAKDVAKEYLEKGMDVNQLSPESIEKKEAAARKQEEVINDFDKFAKELAEKSKNNPAIKNIQEKAEGENNPRDSMVQAQENLKEDKIPSAAQNAQTAREKLENLRNAVQQEIAKMEEALSPERIAQMAAEEAKESAENANKYASQAENEAEKADKALDKAKEKGEERAREIARYAEEAKQAAKQARNAANQAQNEANMAQKEANEAQQQAQQGNRQQAQQHANRAQQHARKAKELEEEAQRNAENAQENAEMAQHPLKKDMEALKEKIKELIEDQKVILGLTKEAAEKKGGKK